ncbi:ATP-binding protein [Halomonas dongshanensis]|uniref:histidine kinase n=1 Tax=Halomonas dongshanensis TaxID=2890835 RepID=A0ABT2ECK3_9GAMM|nr:ATP-binding protein [Halomonas dongshanensis]MCS2608392.1 response regulator [Halomonas dongshanensis]
MEVPQEIDLSTITSKDNITHKMLGFSVRGDDDLQMWQVLHEGEWKDIGQHGDILEAPRQHSTLWLKASLVNSGEEYVERWIELLPWRLNQVDAWLLDPESFEINKHINAGLNVPLDNRALDSNRAIFPIDLFPGERAVLIIRIYADSRPFLSVTGWDPIEFYMESAAKYRLHSMLLASILTLCVVLFLKVDFRYCLLSVWLLITFVFESEKEGYVSQVIFPFLFDYSANLRFITWILVSALFLIASVYLLGLQRSRWRILSIVVLGVSVVFGSLSFVLDGVTMRNVGSAIDLGFSLVWLLMLPDALRIDRKWQFSLLAALSIWWLTANYVLIGYVTNIYYTASFSSIKVIAEIGVILGLLMIYSRQKKAHEHCLERQLREHQNDQLNLLEHLVERRTRELNMALESAHRANEEKTLFLGRITHDLKSPLTSISGYSQLLCAESGSGKVREYAHIICTSAAYMDRLLSQLIGYAKGAISTGESVEDVHIEQFFSTIRQEAEVLVRKNGNRFSMSVIATAFPVARFNAISLRQVVINLIDNAAKYTKEGVVTMDVACYPKNDTTKEANLVITLRDSGCGISKELQDRLFEPFFQESRENEGSGLGLAIVQDLVTNMKGDIHLQSEKGVGTQFRVFIPVTQGDESSLIDNNPFIPAYLLPEFRANGLSAWVVEDLPPILEMFCDELFAMGFEVKAWRSGQEVVALLQQGEELPDLIITDYRLLDASGDQVFTAARQRDASLPVILTSAIWSILTERQWRNDYDYSALLPKPVDLVLFRREVARVCGISVQVKSNSKNLGKSDVSCDMKKLEEFLALGAVSDILDWCDAFFYAKPELKYISDRIRDKASRGDFSAINDLIKELVLYAESERV